METWHICGGKRLEGFYRVQGSKNAALPILAASVLSPCITELNNVPALKDIDTALSIIRSLGCSAEKKDASVYIDSTDLSRCSIPASLMKEMRSSIIFLGALIARCGEASVSIPGGCDLGARPIDIHLSAMRKMGIHIEETGEKIICTSEGITGARLELPFPSVGATENLMLLACAARGETVIINCAREPEIIALQEHLKAMGADIEGAGTDRITVLGYRPETQIQNSIIPDRICASTVLCAVAAAGGDVEINGVIEAHISCIEHFLNRAGCDIIPFRNSVRLRSDGKLSSVGTVKTGPYPMFPTDEQPLLTAALLKANGISYIEENVFENRFRHVPEMKKLGADILTDGKTAKICGVKRLDGAKLTATDLRGGAALVIAGLAADGETEIIDPGHIARGYDHFDSVLNALGAEVSLSID